MKPPSVAYALLLLMVPVLASADERPTDQAPSTATAKERLASKAADPQRLNDCKVPKAKRDDDRPRSDDCAHLSAPGKAPPSTD